jgi:hypothetical protein
MYEPQFFIGVDLGQASDYTAIAIVEAHPERVGEDGKPAGLPHQDARYRRGKTAKIGTVVNVRHLERMRDTSYTDIVDRIVELAQAPELRAEQTYLIPVGEPTRLRQTRYVAPGIAVDATGVGRPVCNLLSAHSLEFDAITITGGSEAHYSKGFYYVPKRDRVSVMQVALQSGWLKIAAELELAETLKRELLNFKVKVNIATGHDSYEAWRENEHDDLVLACWKATRPRPGKPITIADMHRMSLRNQTA